MNWESESDARKKAEEAEKSEWAGVPQYPPNCQPQQQKRPFVDHQRSNKKFCLIIIIRKGCLSFILYFLCTSVHRCSHICARVRSGDDKGNKCWGWLEMNGRADRNWWRISACQTDNSAHGPMLTILKGIHLGILNSGNRRKENNNNRIEQPPGQ